MDNQPGSLGRLLNIFKDHNKFVVRDLKEERRIAVSLHPDIVNAAPDEQLVQELYPYCDTLRQEGFQCSFQLSRNHPDTGKTVVWPHILVERP